MACDFKGLFIFEMANNHQGSLRHGLRIIEEMARLARQFGIRGAIKFQYRELDSFIHPDFAGRKDVPHIPRFLETRLKPEEFAELAAAAREQELLTAITPFDEPSVELALNHGVDALKVASCSAQDWPLLEEIARARRPVICSTGGLRLQDLDKVVNFFEHRGVEDLALLHCVALYPAENKDLNLNFMSRMLRRYRNQTIGYSGHEAPDNLDVVRAAVVMGAQVLERHVGVPTERIKLNAYSLNPEQAQAWVAAALEARRLLGPENGLKTVSDAESAALRSLMRGVYAKRAVQKGEALERSKVFFAMPCAEGQTTSGEYLESMTASRDYAAGAALEERRQYNPIHDVRSVVHDAKGMIREAQIAIGRNYTVELSHHYGMQSFRRIGALIVNIVNREYCKKLIIVLAGQSHPLHHHAVKEETFQVLYGELELTLEGAKSVLRPGDSQLVKRLQNHSFSTRTGCIFEEISTTHVVGDSYYEDEKINRLDPMQRKTVLESW